MKDHYDFRGAERGKFYRPLEELKIPIYLDPQISKDLAALTTENQDLNTLVNVLLRKDIEILRTMKPGRSKSHKRNETVPS